MSEVPFAQVWPSVVQVPLRTRLQIRFLFKEWMESDWGDCEELFNIGNEIWCNRGGVHEHTDPIGEHRFTHGLVLCGHPGLVLHAEGESFPLTTGSVYRLKGHLPHGVTARRCDLFLGFLAWDMHVGEEEPTLRFATKALESAIESVNREKWRWR